jgi:hypothetical protein
VVEVELDWAFAGGAMLKLKNTHNAIAHDNSFNCGRFIIISPCPLNLGGDYAATVYSPTR